MQQAQRNGGMDKKQQKISTPKSLIHVTQMSNNCNMLSEMVSGYMGDHQRVGQGRRHQGQNLVLGNDSSFSSPTEIVIYHKFLSFVALKVAL